MKGQSFNTLRTAAFAILLFGATTGLLANAVFTYSNPQSERVIEDKIPQHVPIKVKLKAEKEKAVKDLNNHNWHRDFELEVTNTSSKPIYFLELWLVLPELVNSSGRPDGFVLRFGRMAFVHFDTRPISTDIPLEPGATYDFKIGDKYLTGWEAHRTREKLIEPTKIEITFTQLSFGDGTGFNGSDARPYP